MIKILCLESYWDNLPYSIVCRKLSLTSLACERHSTPVSFCLPSLTLSVLSKVENESDEGSHCIPIELTVTQGDQQSSITVWEATAGHMGAQEMRRNHEWPLSITSKETWGSCQGTRKEKSQEQNNSQSGRYMQRHRRKRKVDYV